MEELHDRVVREIVNSLNRTNFDVYINPGQEKNAGISGNYPDVIMTTKDTTTVKFIMEVEVAETVTQNEATRQWKKYADEINATMYLVVPEASLQKAKDLCQRNGINCRYVTFKLSNGSLSFNFQ